MAESPAALTSEGVDISVDIEEGGKPAPNSADTLNTSSITSATSNPQIIQPSTSAAETSVADSHAILADMATSNINSTAQDTQNLDTAFTGDDDELSDGDIPPPPPSTPPPAHIINKSINSQTKSNRRKKVGLIVLLILVCAGIGLGLGFGLQSNKNDDSSNKDSNQAVNNSDNEDMQGEENWDDDDVSGNGGWTTTEAPPGEENDVEEEVVVDDTDDTVEQPPEDVIVSFCGCLFPPFSFFAQISFHIINTKHSKNSTTQS